ncbi:MAG: hypothetical protein U0173_02610 [Nitrospiraceae bacterium]
MALVVTSTVAAIPAPPVGDVPPSRHLERAKVFLQAGDFRRALQACDAELRSAPSAKNYVALAYVYRAVHAYLDHLAATDQWVRVEQVYLNLGAWHLSDLVDPPDVMARIAKELIQEAVLQQAELTEAMARRLDDTGAARFFEEQRLWRTTNPNDWWFGIPPEWVW